MKTCFPGFHLVNTRGEISIETPGFPSKHQVFTRGKPGVYLVNTRKIPGQMPTFSMDSQNLKARPYDFRSRRKENTRFLPGFLSTCNKTPGFNQGKTWFSDFSNPRKLAVSGIAESRFFTWLNPGQNLFSR